MTAYPTERMCNICGIIKPLTDFYRRSASKNGYRSYCKTCDNDYSVKNKEKRKILRSGRIGYNAYQRQYTKTIRGRAARIMGGVRRRSNEKSLDLTITIEFVVAKLENGFCERTGIKFVIDENYHPCAPSLDRIDSALGYIETNVQMVCAAYNLGKQYSTDEEFENFILRAARYIMLKRG